MSSNIDGPGDSGGDLLGRHNGLDWVLQCKWKRHGAVGADAVEEVAGARDAYRADRAAVVTNTRISSDASRRVDQLMLVAPRIQLWNGLILQRAFDQASDRFGQYPLASVPGRRQEQAHR